MPRQATRVPRRPEDLPGRAGSRRGCQQVPGCVAGKTINPDALSCRGERGMSGMTQLPDGQGAASTSISATAQSGPPVDPSPLAGPKHDGITLSDEEGQEESPRSRRYGPLVRPYQTSAQRS